MNAKETLNKIRQKYGCKGEIIFRTAIQNVVDCGQQAFQDDEWYEDAIKEIDDRHDAAEAEGKCYIMTRSFEKAILECAKEISVVNTYELLTYIQKEVYFGSGSVGELDYKEAIELIKELMAYIENDKYTIADTLSAFYDVGLDDDQIEMLGFGHVLNLNEE